MQLVYLASPFSSTSEEDKFLRTRAAQVTCAYFAQTAPNICMYSPIAHWGPIEARYSLPQEFEFWSERDYFMLAKSRQFWMLPLEGLAKSKGVQNEAAFADDKGIPRFVIQLNEEQSCLYIQKLVPDLPYVTYYPEELIRATALILRDELSDDLTPDNVTRMDTTRAKRSSNTRQRGTDNGHPSDRD